MNRHLQTWMRHWQRGTRNRRSFWELNALSSTDQRRLAVDVGLPGIDLRRFNCTHDGPVELMPERLRQVGIDPAFVKYALTGTYRDLERVCTTCQSSARCARDLAKGDTQAGMNSYCLNAHTIDSLIVDWPERASA
ncbi:MAG: hypothetical protein AB7O44_33075 [Hyphomicrobiaceae bacterium]|jgi:hypothetical protein